MAEPAPKTSRLVAVLGPTNTGKTHRAIQRMLEHRSGMLGLPLRLLAREVYDRVTRQVGEEAAALITGEEKRVGARARYWVCTVEAMPVTHEVDFLAIDEVQLAGHPSRGHVFTDRLLSTRGREETWFLGADALRPLLRAVLPTVSVESHPRLSMLSARGQVGLGRLPPRSAVVAFNVPEVYRLAERLRHRRGGAAVVLGALSPRARNAQVALYESGDVDYLVATDAIGMGLNLSIKHVAFAAARKFDGREDRLLEPAELAQIAGRAGRHHENGTFGTLAPLAPFPESVERRIEEHRFEPVRRLTWRNGDLYAQSIRELLSSLQRPPPQSYFARIARASDEIALERLAADEEIHRRCLTAARVQLLWQTCQIPDYGEWTPGLHAELVREVFLQLTSPAGVLTQDWLARELRRVDDTSGDVDALTWRIAKVRTWTYVSHHGGWTQDDRCWTERTRDLEDRLSDALHERLVERFVARRRHLLDLPRATEPAHAGDSKPVNGDPFRVLGELRERLFDGARPRSTQAWVDELAAAPYERFQVDEGGHVRVGTERIARLVRGTTLLRPEVKILLADLDGGQRLRLSRRLLAWSRDLVGELLGPLTPGQRAWSPAARGLLYQLEQGLGSAPAATLAEPLQHLTREDRGGLREIGVRLGRHAVYLETTLHAPQRRVRLALSQAFEPRDLQNALALASRVSLPLPSTLDARWIARLGFVTVARRAVRADVLERVSATLHQHARAGEFALPPRLSQWLGCTRDEAIALVLALGYEKGTGGAFRGVRRSRRRGRRGGETSAPQRTRRGSAPSASHRPGPASERDP